MNQPFVSPGTWQFHPLPLFDFQLNRLVMWNHGDPEQIKQNAGQITDFKSWAQVLKELSAQAESEKQWACAAGYLRMAEFFMEPGTEETMQVYETARELKELLQYYHILNDEEPHLGENKYQFYVSDGAEKFKHFANSIIKYGILSAKTIKIDEY